MGGELTREGSYWVVREGEGARDTVLRVLLPTPPPGAPAHPDSAFEATFPPSAGWEYLEARRQRWVEDSTLMVHQREGGCPEVVVEVGGGAGLSQGGAGGVYTPLAGRWSAGRQVFRQEGGEQLYLSILPGNTQWTATSSMEPATKARLASASAGSLCPCTPSTSKSTRFGLHSWMYKAGPGAEGGWKCREESCPADLAVTCKSTQAASAPSAAPGARSALIFLHGLGPSLTTLCSKFLGPALGLDRKRTKVVCPKGPSKNTWVFPFSFFTPVKKFVRSWFNFKFMPDLSVFSPIAGEDKDHLNEALATVEKIIEELEEEGIPSRNIVVSGASQGGVLTLYTAMHSKYKLGGFIPIVTWLPLAQQEPPSAMSPRPRNWNTPILHLNGLQDFVVGQIAGRKTKKEMEKVFKKYTFKVRLGSHGTTMGPQNIPLIKRWMKKNTNLNFKTSIFGGFENLFTGILG